MGWKADASALITVLSGEMHPGLEWGGRLYQCYSKAVKECCVFVLRGTLFSIPFILIEITWRGRECSARQQCGICTMRRWGRCAWLSYASGTNGVSLTPQWKHAIILWCDLIHLHIQYWLACPTSDPEPPILATCEPDVWLSMLSMSITIWTPSTVSPLPLTLRPLAQHIYAWYCGTRLPSCTTASLFLLPLSSIILVLQFKHKLWTWTSQGQKCACVSVCTCVHVYYSRCRDIGLFKWGLIEDLG